MFTSPAQTNQSILQQYYEAEKTCSSPPVLYYSLNLPGLDISMHEFMTIIIAVLTILTSWMAFALIHGHITHWIKPYEQKQILRIIIFIPVFTVAALFSCWFYPAWGFINPWATFYEGFTTTALFMLYVQLIVPERSERPEFFRNLERIDARGKKRHDKGSLRWFRIVSICVFQITITRILSTIALVVIEYTTCPLAKSQLYGSTITQGLAGMSTSITVTAVVLFERRTRDFIPEHKPTLKLLTLKTVVGLQATQGFLFPLLATVGVYKPNAGSYVSYFDFSKGLPEFILAWEMLVTAIAFLWSYDYRVYSDAVHSGTPVVAGPWTALLSLLDVRDVYISTFRAFADFHEPLPEALDIGTPRDKNHVLEKNNVSTGYDSGSTRFDSESSPLHLTE